MSFNLTGGNPRAHRIRVYLFGTTTILEGMPVCYDNSTTNYLGGSMSSVGVVTESTTTSEGSLNEGRYIRVEIPNADNVGMFAGVVAKGSPGIGTAGPSPIDIYVPNGAVVPVLTDQNCLADNTILAITSGEEELGAPIATDSRCVAIARETIDRGTAGLTLAELCPDRFIYQDQGGTALSVDDASTGTGIVVNKINVNFLQATGNCTALWVQGASGAGAASSGYGLALYAQGDVSATPSSHIAASSHWMNVTGGTPDGTYLAVLEAGLWVDSGADLSSAAFVTPLYLSFDVNNAAAPATMFYWYCKKQSGYDARALFKLHDAQLPTAASSVTTSLKVPVDVNGTLYYLALGTETT